MKQYHDLVTAILQNGNQKGDRTGTGTVSIFGYQARYNLQAGFPILTTKFVSFKNIVAELLWFISGSTNINDLHKHDCHIWDSWADVNGELGPIYGKQWRDMTCDSSECYKGIDQLNIAVSQIRNNPNSRRIIVSAWNPHVLPDDSVSPQENVHIGLQSLAPCHTMFQFYVSNNKLSCQLYQRSTDVPLGQPYNVASYSLLVHMIAFITGLEVGDFIWTSGDTHIYNNQIEGITEQLLREPLELPKLIIRDRGQQSLDDFVHEDFSLENYNHHPAIKFPMAAV